MEYQASSVALSQKLSSGHSIYDGVFSSAAASKFNVSTFSSRVDDYSEIFGGSVASRGGSSIPVLEVPELHERKASVDVRSSKLDYSNVFGGCGFGDSDFAVPYEELFAEPKKKERRCIYTSLPQNAQFYLFFEYASSYFIIWHGKLVIFDNLDSSVIEISVRCL